jgi:hypothetical protein
MISKMFDSKGYGARANPVVSIMPGPAITKCHLSDECQSENGMRGIIGSGPVLKAVWDQISAGLTSDHRIFDQAIKNSSVRHVAKTTCGLVAAATNGTRSTRRSTPSVPPPMQVVGWTYATTAIRIV